MIEQRSIILRRVGQRCQDNRGAAHMGHRMLGNGPVNWFGLYFAQADMRRHGRGYPPGEGPAIAMEHR